MYPKIFYDRLLGLGLMISDKKSHAHIRSRVYEVDIMLVYIFIFVALIKHIGVYEIDIREVEN
jgi:hypothetical protein